MGRYVRRLIKPVLAVLALISASQAWGTAISLTGQLAPLDPNDVLFIVFSVSGATTVDMQSYGFGGSADAPGATNAAGTVIPSGGFDTYFSLFAGTGPSATFLSSNDDGSCPPGDATEACSDSSLDVPLGAGNYTLAVSAFDNFSFAENQPPGTLGDGFIGLGSYFSVSTLTDRTSNYAVDIVGEGVTFIESHRLSDQTPTVPEPNVAELLLISMGALIVSRYRKGASTTAGPA